MSVPTEWRGAARYGLPGLLLGLALAWSFGAGPHPAAQAQTQASPSEANGTIAFTSTTANGSAQLLYLIDTKGQSFAVYRVEPSQGPRSSGSVKLESARKYRWDLQLSEYNNLAPEVRAVESMVKSVGGGRN